MKKKLLLMVLVLLSANSIFALDANYNTAGQGMGLGGRGWMVDGVMSYIFENPAYLKDYKNQIYFEYESDYFGGLILSPSDLFTIGVFTGKSVNNEVWNDYNGYIGNLYYKKNYYSSSVNNYYQRLNMNRENLSLLASLDLGLITLGFQGGMALKKEKDEVDEITNYKSKINHKSIQYYGGASFILDLGSIRIDTSALTTFYKLKNIYNYESSFSKRNLKYESDGAMDLNAKTRVTFFLSNHNKMHLHAGFGLLNRSTKGKYDYIDYNNSSMNNFTDDNFERKGYTASIAISDEILFTKNNRMFFGLDANYTKMKYDFHGTESQNNVSNKLKGKSQQANLYLVFGAEAEVLKNFTTRFGIKHKAFDISKKEDNNSNNSINNNKSEDNKTEFWSDPDTSVSVGLSLKLWKFKFDWDNNLDLFKKGPNILSGADVDFATSFACTFYFDDLLKKI